MLIDDAGARDNQDYEPPRRVIRRSVCIVQTTFERWWLTIRALADVKSNPSWCLCCSTDGDLCNVGCFVGVVCAKTGMFTSSSRFGREDTGWHTHNAEPPTNLQGTTMRIVLVQTRKELKHTVSCIE